MYEDEDDDLGEDINGYFEEQAREVAERTRRETLKSFIEGCYVAYDLLAKQGSKAMEGSSAESIGSAINRMTALFLKREEYERCGFLQKFVTEHMPGMELVPDPQVIKELKELEADGYY
jgi:hypothetical protein